MSRSSLEHIDKLDTILYDRPAGRNVIGHAVVTIQKLRSDLAVTRALLGEARGIVHAYLRGWPNSDAGELMDRIDAAIAGEKK